MKEKNMFQIYGWLSKSIVKILSKDTVDSEALITLSIYLKLGILRAYCPNISTVKAISSKLINNPAIEGEWQSFDDLNSTYEDNSDTLIGICNEVWSTAYDDGTQWLGEWITFCENIFKQESHSEQVLTSLFIAVQDHLEIKSNASFILNTMIARTFDRL